MSEMCLRMADTWVTSVQTGKAIAATKSNDQESLSSERLRMFH